MWCGLRDGSGELMTRTSDTSHVGPLRRHLVQVGAVRQHSRYTLPANVVRPSEAEALATIAAARQRADEIAARAPPPEPAETPTPDSGAFRTLILERLGTRRMTARELAAEVTPLLGGVVSWRGQPYSTYPPDKLTRAIATTLRHVPYVTRKGKYVSAVVDRSATHAQQTPTAQPDGAHLTTLIAIRFCFVLTFLRKFVCFFSC